MDAFESIEAQAAAWSAEGFESVDSEPGEWLVMEHPDGRTVTITPEEA
ncbi:MAG: hypothetical protein ACRDOS_09080 [Gaiellaceae bacterium]